MGPLVYGKYHPITSIHCAVAIVHGGLIWIVAHFSKHNWLANVQAACRPSTRRILCANH